MKQVVNQVGVNPFYQQIEAQSCYEKYNIQMETWATFVEGKNNMFNDPKFKAIGDKYHKSVAQVILRYLMQRGIVSLTKSVKRTRVEC